MNISVLVIGGGAAGMMAAISAANSGALVTLYEKNNSLGKKLLQTGNGKCNITNKNLRLDCYYSSAPDKLNNYFGQFDSEDTISVFQGMGLILKDDNGYIYPACEQASVVRNILLNKMLGMGIEICYETIVTKIETNAGGQYVVYTDSDSRVFDRVVIATGSYAGLRKTERIDSSIDGYSLAYHMGHKIIPVKPALTQVVCKNDFCKDISGVRVDCIVSLGMDGTYVGSEYGQLQLTDYGVSGIPIFQLSRIIAADPNHEYEFVVDMMPGVSEDTFIQMMESRILANQGATVSAFFEGLLNTKLNSLLIRLAGLKEDDIVNTDTEDAIITAVSMVKCLRFDVKETRGFENAQCCSGGVSLYDISDSCESIYSPGLYFCGEILDVDGKCGGYNLQWAWTTGYIAGEAAAKG